ncbi:MAG TPA: DNA mismatch repair protein MutS [Candidatus Krumholzibacteria bacterium]|nr:DNA mismatch repair protein MutS [Candidatus Krumholzibacteria bacterium]
MSDTSPLMSQYRDIKKQYPDSVLLFRVGDFYETFYEDAIDIASILNITLTSRDKNKAVPVPLAGVPFHAAEGYIGRLLAAGRKVAICEQTEDPALAKGLVKRDVVEVLTPGTALNAQLVADPDNNYCAAVHANGDGRVAVALIDVGTGECVSGEAPADSFLHLVQGKRVRELVISNQMDPALRALLSEHLELPFITEIDESEFASATADDVFKNQFGASTESAAGSLAATERVVAAALISHCMRLRGARLSQVVRIERTADAPFMLLDEETIGNLELFDALRGGRNDATVLRILDRTRTPMGNRELRHWMQKPLCDVAAIDARLDAVARVYSDATLAETLVRELGGVADIQRIAARIGARKAIPRELHALRESLAHVPALKDAARGAGVAFFAAAAEALGDHRETCEMIERAIVPEPPSHLRDGGVIRRGYDSDLDTLIDESEDAKRWIAGLEAQERAQTGIASLKVGYNKVFGYFIEVSNAHKGAIPAHYVAKQSLVNAQRYFTPELKDKEDLILHTEERRVREENRVYDALCAAITARAEAIQRAAGAIARMDAAQSLAMVARTHGYRRPIVDESMTLEIVGGRHAVLERVVTEPFVANDLQLDPERRQFGLITGPNMSGKSTFLRQTALIVLMAQMGSFVPAERARIGIVDRIFTRVGASDRLSRGESTFLVEMNETANILHHMTDRSLVILDEVGRGTSTYDGLAIAWAVTEYLLQGVVARPRALFATHFHELTQLKSTYPRLVNLKIAIREWEGGIVFLRKIVPGTSDRSFGIHAAKVAGLPALVIKRAEEILQSLELRRDLVAKGLEPADRRDQMNLFVSDSAPGADDELRAALNEFDPDASTPLQALQFLQDLKQRLK